MTLCKKCGDKVKNLTSMEKETENRYVFTFM